MSDSEIIDYFSLSYSYEIKNCNNHSGSGNMTIENTSKDYFIIELEEDSDIYVSLIAVNTAGQSAPATFRTATSTAREL